MTKKTDKEKFHDLLDAMEAARRKELAKLAKKTSSKEQAAREAAHLKSWAKGRPITKWDRTGASTFWQCGKFMTKIEPDAVNGLVKFGHATLSADGCTLKML